MMLMTQAPAVMGLKVTGPTCSVGTRAMGTASKGPRAIPAALHVTNAAAHTSLSCKSSDSDHKLCSMYQLGKAALEQASD